MSAVMIEATYSHFSAKPVTLRRERVYTQKTHPKPRGLWLSVDGRQSWDEWCQSEDWGIDWLAHRHSVSLKKNNRVLFLRTPEAIREFTDQYWHDDPLRRTYAHHRWEIDWPRVAQESSGIVIAPYQWSCRLESEFSWYYGWDCASGCIWDLNDIEEFG